MPVAQLTASGTPDVMKPEDGKDSLDTLIKEANGKDLVDTLIEEANGKDSVDTLIEEANGKDSLDTLIEEANGKDSVDTLIEEANGKDSLDTLIEEAIGKEPVIYYPRIGENSSEWLQFLQALEHPEPPVWPFFPLVKVQLRKCDKCSREFCSPLNYRRHMRIDHRLKKLDKDSKINRDLLGEYWDKLSVEEAMEVLSFEDVMLEEVTGSSILKGVATLRRQAFSSLPQYYLRAGSAILDIIQAQPSLFPISSEELFIILDNASEQTFLCGTLASVQKFMFDRETGKIGIEPRNLIACTSFLLEQKMVNSWLAYKDAEALRWQKLLMDEEEAAQKRQAEILERKRQKKLRQKAQKARERLEDDMKIEGNISSTGEDVSPTEASLAAFDFEAHNPDIPADHDSSSHVVYQCPDTNEGVGGETQTGYDCDTDQIIEQQTSQGDNSLLPMTASQQEVPKSQAPVADGLYAEQNSQMSKLGAIQKHETNCDQNAAPKINGGKVLSWKKPEPGTKGVVSKARLREEPDEAKNHEVLIGSVSVTLGSRCQSEGDLAPSRGVCSVENLAKQNTADEKLIKHDSHQGCDNQILSAQNSLRFCSINGSDSAFKSNFSHTGAKVDGERLRLSSQAARAFLAQRWKEAISSDHVKLVITPDTEPPVSQRSNVDRCSIPANTEKPLPATSGAAKSKPRKKAKKEMKMKLTAKHETTAQ